MGVWMIRGCVALGVLLGAVMPAWPYGHACGWGLIFYAMSVGVLVSAGVWGLIITWTSRLSLAHTIALGTLLWGLALSAQIVLPRVGYAASQATWTCVR